MRAGPVGYGRRADSLIARVIARNETTRQSPYSRVQEISSLRSQ